MGVASTGTPLPQVTAGQGPYPQPPAQAAHQSAQLRQFWLQQADEISQVGTDMAEFKNHQLQLARIKKVGVTLCVAHWPELMRGCDLASPALRCTSCRVTPWAG